MFFLLLIILINADYSRWMSFVNDKRMLTDLTIPGAHQSIMFMVASSNIYLKTQTLTIQEQLISGCRYFEISLSINTDNHTLNGEYNGFFGYYTFAGLQSVLINFLNENPSEVIILKVSYDQQYDLIKNTNFDDIIQSQMQKSYYYINNNIPKIDNVRKKIIMIKNFTSNMSLYDYNNTLHYDNVMIKDCNMTHFKINEIENHITNSTDQTIYCITSTSAYNYPNCTSLTISNIINPIISSYLQNLSKFGIIAVDNFNSSFAYDIFSKNNLYVNVQYEILASACIALLLFIILNIQSICRYQYDTAHIIFLLSILNTIIHIFGIYYFYQIATYRDFNTLLSSQYILIINVILWSLLFVFNLLLLRPKCSSRFMYVVHWWFSGEQQHDTLQYYNVQLLNSHIVRILSLLCNCNYLVNIIWTYNGISTYQISTQYMICYAIMLLIMMMIFFFDVILIFLFDYTLVVSPFAIMLILTSATNYVYNIIGLRIYMTHIQDFFR